MTRSVMSDSHSLARRVFRLSTALCGSTGVFVEAGANDGVRQSNTILLEQVGWTGVLIEPSPVAFDQLRTNRPKARNFQCALVDREERLSISGTFSTGSLMASADSLLRHRDALPSRIRGEARLRRALGFRPRGVIQVPARTLASILSEARLREVDLLSLDVEGQELQALRGLGSTVHPRLIVVETRRIDSMAIAELLLSRGYVLAGNLSGFSADTHPQWTGDHQDFAWCRAEDEPAVRAINSAGCRTTESLD